MHSCNTARNNTYCLSQFINDRLAPSRVDVRFSAPSSDSWGSWFEAVFVGNHALVVSGHTGKSKLILFKFIHKIIFLWLFSSLTTRKSWNSGSSPMDFMVQSVSDTVKYCPDFYSVSVASFKKDPIPIHPCHSNELTERLTSAVSHCSGSICNHALKRIKRKDWNASKLSVQSKKENKPLLISATPGPRQTACSAVLTAGRQLAGCSLCAHRAEQPHSRRRGPSGAEWCRRDAPLSFLCSSGHKKQFLRPPYSWGQALTFWRSLRMCSENL